MKLSGFESFSCPACGRRYGWKPAMAGKTARCICGTILHVPNPNELSVRPLSLPSPTSTSGDLQVDTPPRTNVLDYRKQPLVDSMADRVHDIYLPTGLLILGTLALLAWIVAQGRGGIRESITISQLTGAAIVLKIALLGLVGWFFARKSGAGFAALSTTVLKIAALAIFLDGVCLWLRVAMTESGMMSSSGAGPPGVLTLQLMVLLFAALFVSRFIYKLEDSEATTFGCLIAIGNFVVNALLVLGAAASLHMCVVARGRAAAASAAPRANALAATNSQNTTIIMTEADREVAHRISRGSPAVMEGREWKLAFASYDRRKVASVQLIDKMYAAGAAQVYIDLVQDATIQEGGKHGRLRLYVDLPLGQSQRNVCLDAARAYCDENELPPIRSDAVAGRFLTIDMKQ